jgi:hypothetical protein
MANRTLQFFGIGYGAEPVTVTATVNGTQVFNGTITTFNSPVNTVNPWTQMTPLFTAEVDETMVENIPMSVTVSGGTAVFGDVHADRVLRKNSIYTAEDFVTLMNTEAAGPEISAVMSKYATPAFSAEELALVESKNPADSTARKALLQSRDLEPYSLSAAGEFLGAHTAIDSRSNVTVNGAPVSDSDSRAHKSPPANRPVYWQVDNGETLACALRIPQAQPN